MERLLSTRDHLRHRGTQCTQTRSCPHGASSVEYGKGTEILYTMLQWASVCPCFLFQRREGHRACQVTLYP